MGERGWSTTDSRSLAPGEPATTYSPLLPRLALPARSRSTPHVETRGGEDAWATGRLPPPAASAHPSPPPPPPPANPILIPFWARHLTVMSPAPRQPLGAHMQRPHLGHSGGVCAGPLTARREGRGRKWNPQAPPLDAWRHEGWRRMWPVGVGAEVFARVDRRGVAVGRRCAHGGGGGGGATTPTAAAAAEAAATEAAATAAGGPPPISGWARVAHQRRRRRPPRRAAATSGRGAGAKLDRNLDTKSVRGPSVHTADSMELMS